MVKYENDERIVLTLDAGGTNFVFSAMQANHQICEPIVLPSEGSKLDACLNNISLGFKKLSEQIFPKKPSAISFAFPGPADYPSGIIGDLGNLPAFRGGVPLGPMLEDMFKVPAFINNDGDLFAYGEAIAGFLPLVNQMLEKQNNPKRYNNLIGFTLGTGFGGGVVIDGKLLPGDNSASGEVWLMRNKLDTKINAEEGVSIRAIRGVYAEYCKLDLSDAPSPKDIYQIAQGQMPGNKEAAIAAFKKMAEIAGDAISNAVTLVDGLVVIGGGISGAYPLFLSEIVKEMNSQFNVSGKVFPRLEVKAFNLEDENQKKDFLLSDAKEIAVPFSDRKVLYDSGKKIGVGISKLGTSNAVSVGAYVYALSKIDG
jgi:glucokinase